MNFSANPLWLMVVLLISILWIILGTTKLKVHPFLSLLTAAYLTGALAGLPAGKIALVITSGFGNIMASIGMVIILGTLIGVNLEKSNGAIKLAEMVIKLVGRRYPGLAMSIIGYIVSIPVFCDSAFIILSSLKKSLIGRTGKSPVLLTISLATGLYATHTFVPPTPGPIAAAGNLGLEDYLGKVILFGLVTAIFAMITGYLWAWYSGKKYVSDEKLPENDTQSSAEIRLPSGFRSLMPIVVPIFLIAIRSLATFPSKPLGEGFIFLLFEFSGQPVNALLLGFILTLLLFPSVDKKILSDRVGEGISAAAPILLITGAGGAFGSMLKETQIGDTLGNLLVGYQLGILLPFIIAAAFKTAQGSSTVAMVAASALVAPLLPMIGLDSINGKVLAVMAIGAGAMTLSHANDSYFWVVTQFSGMDVKTGMKTHAMATLIQGMSTMIFIYFLSLIIL